MLPITIIDIIARIENSGGNLFDALKLRTYKENLADFPKEFYQRYLIEQDSVLFAKKMLQQDLEELQESVHYDWDTETLEEKNIRILLDNLEREVSWFKIADSNPGTSCIEIYF